MIWCIQIAYIHNLFMESWIHKRTENGVASTTAIALSMATTSKTISTEYIALLWLLLKRRTFNMGILLNAIFIEIIRSTNANLISIYVLPNCAILVAAFFSLRITKNIKQNQRTHKMLTITVHFLSKFLIKYSKSNGGGIGITLDPKAT